MPNNPAAPVIKAGAQGVAMMRSISGAERPEAAAREFLDVVKEARENGS